MEAFIHTAVQLYNGEKTHTHAAVSNSVRVGSLRLRTKIEILPLEVPLELSYTTAPVYYIKYIFNKQTVYSCNSSISGL